MSQEALNVVASAAEPDSGGIALTAAEASRLLGICVDLIDLCAKVTGKIEPVVGTVVKHARDEAISEAFEVDA